MKTALRQVSLATTPEAEEAVCQLMRGVFGNEASVFSKPDQRGPVVSVYIPEVQAVSTAERQAVAAGLKAIGDCGLPVGEGRLVVKKLRREDWVDSWKRHFKPIDIAGRLLIKPLWRSEKAAPGQSVIILDPGLSFGTGHHATTKFCLRQLVAHRSDSRAQSMLDVGTGSGILAIAAAKLGYEPIQAFDFDAVAVRVAGENAKRNRVAKQVQPTLRDVTKLPERARVKFGVVCANLMDHLLIESAERLIGRVKPKGVLLLAGILDSQFVQVQRVYEQLGMELQRTDCSGDWRSGSFVHADWQAGQRPKNSS
jgi:ribosomal protein L11 methyltransferase